MSRQAVFFKYCFYSNFHSKCPNPLIFPHISAMACANPLHGGNPPPTGPYILILICQNLKNIRQKRGLELMQAKNKFHDFHKQCGPNLARQATFDFGNKYHQMESSDVAKKIQRVVTGRQVVTCCCQGLQSCILVVTQVVRCHPEQSHRSSHKIHHIVTQSHQSAFRHLVVFFVTWSPAIPTISLSTYMTSHIIC